MSALVERPPPALGAAIALLKTLTVASQVRQTLAALARLAAWAADAPIAVLVATLPDRVETLAAQGEGAGELAAAWSFQAPGISPRELFAAADARKHAFFARKVFVRQAPKLRAILRYPVRSDHLPFAVAIGIADTRVRDEANWPTPRLRELLYAIAAVAEAEIAVAADIASVNDSDPENNPSRAELLQGVTRSAEPAMLLDDSLRLVRANASMAALLGVSREAADRFLSDFPDPGAQILATLARSAAEGGERVADIAFDLRREDGDPVARNASISVDPLEARDRSGKFLLVRARDITQPLSELARLETLIAPPATALRLGEPASTLDFLSDTLVPRTMVRARRAMTYITLRAWRAAIKSHQLKALSALKQAPPPALIETIAAEMQEAIELTIGRAAFSAIVPVPSGDATLEHSFSAQIAESLAVKLDLPCIAALRSEWSSGASHAVDNMRRPPMRLAQDPRTPVLLVDDIATTGRHLEEAAVLLRPGCRAVFAMAWIGGGPAD